MDIKPTFKERKISDIKLVLKNAQNGKEIMYFMRKNVDEIREYYAKKRAELYEEEGFLIKLLISELKNRKNQIS